MKITFVKDPPNLLFEIDYSVEFNLKSFKEEVLNSLYNEYKNNDITHLLLSDGMDSRFIALCLRELDLKIKPVTFYFNSYDTDVLLKAKKFCSNFLIEDHTPFLIEYDRFFKYVNHLTENGKAYPYLNGYYVSYIINEIDSKFFTGMSSEYKFYDNEFIDLAMITPYLVKFNNPERLFSFSNSRTFLSYINHPIFLKNYNVDRFSLERSDQWYIRDLIYKSIFPELEVELKKYDFFNVRFSYNFYVEYYEKIKKAVPWVFKLQNGRFNVKQYFERKN